MNKLIKIFFAILIINLMLIFIPVYAENGATANPGGGATANQDSTSKTNNATENKQLVKLQNPLRVNSIEEVIYLGIDILIYVGVAFAIFAIIFTGFKFVWAQGNPKEIEEAKKRFYYILIGLAVLISSRVIVQIVRTTLEQAGVVKENTFINPIR
jgi:heme/copper-type cytochrome/quinol oxidase subunit 3